MPGAVQVLRAMFVDRTARMRKYLRHMSGLINAIHDSIGCRLMQEFTMVGYQTTGVSAAYMPIAITRILDLRFKVPEGRLRGDTAHAQLSGLSSQVCALTSEEVDVLNGFVEGTAPESARFEQELKRRSPHLYGLAPIPKLGR